MVDQPFDIIVNYCNLEFAWEIWTGRRVTMYETAWVNWWLLKSLILERLWGIDSLEEILLDLTTLLLAGDFFFFFLTTFLGCPTQIHQGYRQSSEHYQAGSYWSCFWGPHSWEGIVSEYSEYCKRPGCQFYSFRLCLLPAWLSTIQNCFKSESWCFWYAILVIWNSCNAFCLQVARMSLFVCWLRSTPIDYNLKIFVSDQHSTNIQLSFFDFAISVFAVLQTIPLECLSIAFSDTEALKHGWRTRMVPL